MKLEEVERGQKVWVYNKAATVIKAGALEVKVRLENVEPGQENKIWVSPGELTPR
jgi:hypothetical protein